MAFPVTLCSEIVLTIFNFENERSHDAIVKGIVKKACRVYAEQTSPKEEAKA